MTSGRSRGADGGSGERSWVDDGARPAAVAFAVVAAAAGVYYLVIGRHQWFFADEWDQIVTRSAAELDDVLRPHNGHLQVIPTLLYRALFRIFGLTTYLPYQIPVVTAFVSSGVFIRVIARRAGAGPWVATLVGVLFLTLGSGMENIVFGIQISMMGSVAFGLAALVLVDDDRGREWHSDEADPARGRSGRWWTRRDTAALGCGALSLLCSGIGITMVAVVTLVLLVRRGWRPAVVFAAPLAVMQLAWTLWYRAGEARPGSVGAVVRFVVAAFDEAARDLSQLGTIGAVALLAVLAAGCVLRVGPDADRSGAWATAVDLAAPLALLAGTVGLLVFTAIGRAGPFGPESARGERYTTLAVAFLLPLLGVAVDAICRRSTPAGALTVAFLLVGGGLNVRTGLDQIEARDAAIARARAVLVALPVDPRFGTAPDEMRPLPESGMAPDVTVGWLRRAVDEGWIDPPSVVDPVVAAEASFRLLLAQTAVDAGRGDRAEPTDCVDLPPAGDTPVVVGVDVGDVLVLDGGIARITAADPDAVPISVTYNPNRGSELVVRYGPAQLALTSTGINGPAQLCGTG